MLKKLTMLALGSVLLAACGAKKDESAAQTEAPTPAVEAPAAMPEETMPYEEPAPATSDTLPTTEEPPPSEPPPPNG